VFVKTCKALYNYDPYGPLGLLALSTMVNFARYSRVSRAVIMGSPNTEGGSDDLIEVRICLDVGPRHFSSSLYPFDFL
jgi:hypothetical protein